MARLALTAKEATLPENKAFIEMLLDLTKDGKVTQAELKSLAAFIESNTFELEAYYELKLRINIILREGRPTPLQCQEFQYLIESILPEALQDTLISKLGTNRPTLAEIKTLMQLGYNGPVPMTKAEAWNLKEGLNSNSASTFTTEAQANTLKNLGYKGVAPLNSASANKLIDALTAARDSQVKSENKIYPTAAVPENVTPQQLMLLTFWNIPSENLSKNQVSNWLDTVHLEDPSKRLAWEKYKLDNAITDNSTQYLIEHGCGWQYLELVSTVKTKEIPSSYMDLKFYVCNPAKIRVSETSISAASLSVVTDGSVVYEEESPLTELGFDATFYSGVELKQKLAPTIIKLYPTLPPMGEPELKKKPTPPPLASPTPPRLPEPEQAITHTVSMYVKPTISIKFSF